MIQKATVISGTRRAPLVVNQERVWRAVDLRIAVLYAISDEPCPRGDHRPERAINVVDVKQHDERALTKIEQWEAQRGRSL